MRSLLPFVVLLNMDRKAGSCVVFVVESLALLLWVVFDVDCEDCCFVKMRQAA